jgi:hypothetical protein
MARVAALMGAELQRNSVPVRSSRPTWSPIVRRSGPSAPTTANSWVHCIGRANLKVATNLEPLGHQRIRALAAASMMRGSE